MPKSASTRMTAVRLTESAIMLAFATVLSLVKIVDLPYGGSITACSMLPILIIAYRYGTGWGLFCADEFPLGWGKASGGQWKNHYPKGLRQM